MKRIYTAWAMGVVLLFAVAQAQGWHFGGGKSGKVPQAQRTVGGYRSYHFWRGGK